ncbi:MAG: hypothetical protein EOP64_00355 [Sphingomonas sp.]|nr:MAG: hypothetical protein EOP64_00355 [Sphingomonas sp.]
MPFDPTIVAIHAERWRSKKFVSLPQDESQPVIWIDNEDRLAMYHPALSLPEEGATVPFQWDELNFRKMVAEIRAKCGEVVQRRMQERGVPDNYYGTFVLECQRIAKLA